MSMWAGFCFLSFCRCIAGSRCLMPFATDTAPLLCHPWRRYTEDTFGLRTAEEAGTSSESHDSLHVLRTHRQARECTRWRELSAPALRQMRPLCAFAHFFVSLAVQRWQARTSLKRSRASTSGSLRQSFNSGLSNISFDPGLKGGAMRRNEFFAHGACAETCSALCDSHKGIREAALMRARAELFCVASPHNFARPLLRTLWKSASIASTFDVDPLG
eukprot:6187135-Pleurochrysis_carterae.AAC.1